MRFSSLLLACPTQYDVGYSEDGSITALDIECFMNAGYSSDISDFCIMSWAKAVDQA
jgi:xanthine dehydrogenase molybdopterin-binding subunit B